MVELIDHIFTPQLLQLIGGAIAFAGIWYLNGQSYFYFRNPIKSIYFINYFNDF